MFSPFTLFIYAEKKLYTGSGVSQLLVLFLCLKYFTVFFSFFLYALVVLPEWEAPLSIVYPVSPRVWLVGTFDVNDAIYFSILVD